MAEGVFPPIVADVLILLSVALGVIALIMAAGVASLQKQMRDDVKKIVGLEHDVAKLKRQVAGLQAAQGEAGSAKEPHHADHGTPPQGEPHGASQALGGAQAAAPLTPAERQARAAQQPARPQNVWTPMLMDYNSLAASMQVPRADEACQAFIDIHHIQMLRTAPHKVQGTDGHLVPQYETTDNFQECTYWGWHLPDDHTRAVVLPNPYLGCTPDLYEEKGYKETFASNYESGDYKQVEVKLPAMFRIEGNRWVIDQPGVIKVK